MVKIWSVNQLKYYKKNYAKYDISATSTGFFLQIMHVFFNINIAGWLKPGKTYYVTNNKWLVTAYTWICLLLLNFYIFFFGIFAIICIHWEMWCLPYADFVKGTFYEVKKSWIAWFIKTRFILYVCYSIKQLFNVQKTFFTLGLFATGRTPLVWSSSFW